MREFLKRIDERLMRLETSANRMNDHITFIERVWARIKRPFITMLWTTPSQPPLLQDAGGEPLDR